MDLFLEKYWCKAISFQKYKDFETLQRRKNINIENL